MNLQKMAEKNMRKIPSMEYENDITDFNYFSGSISMLNEMQRPHTNHLRYKDYMESGIWKMRRELYIDHFDGICQHPDCGRHRKPLQLHHLTYQRLGVEALDDVVLVCKTCHRMIEWDKSQN